MIPARRNSQGVKNKNLRPLPDGRNLVQVAVECARTCGILRGKSTGESSSVVVVSNYKRDEIGLPDGLKVIRQPELFAHHCPTMLPLLVYTAARIDAVPDDVFCLLQPTSPLRRPATVMGAIERFCWLRPLTDSDGEHYDGGSDSICTAMRYPDIWHPAYQLAELGEPARPLPASRQSLRWAYRPDGGAYVSSVSQLLTGSWGRLGWIESANFESLSIDTEDDWEEACRRLAGASSRPQDERSGA